MAEIKRAPTRALRLVVLVFLAISLVFAISCSLLAQAATATYTYDALGRLTKVTHSANGAVSTYAYDAGNDGSVSFTAQETRLVTGSLIPKTTTVKCTNKDNAGCK